jgi:hypothetical protein
MAGATHREIAEQKLRTRQITPATFERLRAKFFPNDTTAKRTHSGPVGHTVVIAPHLLPLLNAEPHPKTPEQIAADRAAMSPTDALTDYLKG